MRKHIKAPRSGKSVFATASHTIQKNVLEFGLFVDEHLFFKAAQRSKQYQWWL